PGWTLGWSGDLSPRKRKAKSQAHVYDRFIPNNTNGQQFLHRNIRTGKDLNSPEQEYQKELACAYGLAIDKNILEFKVEHHQPNNHYQKIDQLNQIYNCQPESSCIKKRIIPTSPEYTLDVLGVIDDYYLNILDWSNQNIVAVGIDKRVYLWDIITDELSAITIIRSGTNTISSLSWSEDGDHLAVGLNDGNIEIWNIWSVQKIRSMNGHTTRVGVMTWNKHIIASGCRDGSIWKHDIRLAQHKFGEMHNHNREVCGLKWRSDGEQLASGGDDCKVNIWDAKSSIPKFTKTDHKAAAIAWSPWQRNLLATGGGIADQQIYFWNTDTSLQLKSINTQSQVTSIVWSNHYNEVLSTHGDPNFQFTIWKYPSLKKIIDVKHAHSDCILHSALSPGGEIVATLGDECLKFWRVFQKQRKIKNLIR
ncbi:3297_t:CDS:2, partial [Entrophospora sp. SA101]